MPRTRRILTAFLLTRASIALAGTPAEEAREHFSRGVELAEQNDLAGAVREFEAAYDASPNPAVFYNLGQAYVGLERPVDAVNALSRYLEEAGDKVSAERRAEVEAQLRELGTRVATLQVEVTPPAARVLVDGAEIPSGTSPGALSVVPGAHRLSVSLPGYIPDERTVTSMGGQTTRVVFNLAPVVVAPVYSPPVWTPAPPPPEAERRTHVGDSQRIVGYVVGVAGLAGLGVGTAFAAVMKSKGDARNHVAESCNPRCSNGDVDRVLSLQEDARSAAKIANVAFIAGSVLTAAGVTIVLTAPNDRSQISVSASPWIEASSLGASARGTF